MTTYEIHSNTLRAALSHAGKRDVRFYLNGVCLDLNAGRIVATDGNRMFICRGPLDAGAGQVIIPRDVIESAVKAADKKGCMLSVSIVTGEAGTATLALPSGAQFGATLIDGRFPDWQRVI